MTAAEALVGAGLAALRAGTLAGLLQQRPRTVRWLDRRALQAIRGAGGDVLRGNDADAVRMLLAWGVSRLRPDRRTSLDDIEPAAWLDRTSWRPMLALACHSGLLAAPDFPARYRRRPDEAAVDNLCGLWNVGTSTFYRYLDKGKRQLAEVLVEATLDASSPLAQRRFVQERFQREAPERGADGWAAWHARQAEAAVFDLDPASAMWHLARAGDARGFIGVLQRFRTELANEDDTDALIDEVATAAPGAAELFDLHVAHAALHLTRCADDKAQQAYDRALRIARAAGDKRRLGIVYGALAKFYEARDTDRMLAYLEDGAEFLRQASIEAAASGDAAVVDDYVAALQKIAWALSLRNDPRSRSVLETAAAMLDSPAVQLETRALLEQTWGEYWRRTGDPARAAQHQLKVLNMFELLGDTRQVLSTYNNLSIIYGEAKNHERAIDYAQRVVSMAGQVRIEPYILANTLLNLGANYFWLGRYDDAIAQYERALSHSEAAGLKVIAHRAHFNLAEAHYKKFQLDRAPDSEHQGDLHAAAVLEADPAELDSFARDAALSLKAEVLGPHEGAVYQRIEPGEFAVHREEMAEVQRLRTTLALPASPAEHVSAHLAIANAYLAISAKEREAALALIRQHDLGDQFDADIDALRITFSRELTREKVLQAQWHEKSYGVLTQERAAAVLGRVLQAGAINKSGYAQLCQVGLATASKHLCTLAERGLLVQTGKGPSTRYVLPA